MGRYLITISATVDADNQEEAEDIAQAIVNAELDEEVERKIVSLHYHDGYGTPEIRVLRD